MVKSSKDMVLIDVRRGSYRFVRIWARLGEKKVDVDLERMEDRNGEAVGV